MVRINMNLGDSLVEKIDEFAKEMNINRTAAVSILCTNALKNMEAMDVMKELLEMFDRYGKNGQLPTDEELKLLDAKVSVVKK